MGHARLVRSMIADIVKTIKQLACTVMMVLAFINYLHACHAIIRIFAYIVQETMQNTAYAAKQAMESMKQIANVLIAQQTVLCAFPKIIYYAMDALLSSIYNFQVGYAGPAQITVHRAVSEPTAQVVWMLITSLLTLLALFARTIAPSAFSTSPSVNHSALTVFWVQG